MIIYRTINYINKKIYIGQTKRKSDLINNYYKGGGTILAKAFKKYGIENFHTFIVVEGDFNQKLTDELEAHYIQLFNSTNKKVGYNIKPGAVGNVMTIEIRQKISKTNKGKIKTKEWRKNLSKSLLKSDKNGDAVVQFDWQWNKIAEYKSILIANEACGGKYGDYIKFACKDHKRSAFGFKWRYKDEINKTDFNYLKSKVKAIVQTSLDGVIVAKYKTAKEAAIKISGVRSLINAVCNNTRGQHKGFKWHYENIEIANPMYTNSGKLVLTDKK